MPKRDEKKVFCSGICTWPPSASALNRFSASASSATVSDNEKPANAGLPLQWPSEAITVVSPIFMLTCITLFSDPGGSIPGGCGSGLSLLRMSIRTSAFTALR